jgi:lon-related putative ATP-dependent protease
VTQVQPLTGAALRRRCDPESLPFGSTSELEDLTEIVGHARAAAAIGFGVGIRRAGYNLFVLGPAGSGKHTIVREYVERKARAEQTPSDWCYVNNFADSHKPIALELPPGNGRKLRDDVEWLLKELKVVLPATFASDSYRTRKEAIEQELKNRQAKAFEDLTEQARSRGIALARMPVGFMLAPLKEDRILPPEEFQALEEKEREEIESKTTELRAELQLVLDQFPEWERESREKLRRLDEEVTIIAVKRAIDALRVTYASLPRVIEHIDRVQQEVIAHVGDFLNSSESTMLSIVGGRLPGFSVDLPALRRYGVNVVIDHADEKGAPVVYEDQPSHPNVVGSVEHVAQLGALVTDFLLIKPGALHRANGGYLLLDARELLLQPYAWDGVKQALRSGKIRVQSIGQMLGFASTVTLEPDPIPLDVKVVLLGDRLIYYLLDMLDPRFPELFKVAVDFEDDIDRSAENNLLFSRLIATVSRRENLLPFAKEAVARVLDESARSCGDAEKLSMRVGLLADLLREADHWAREDGRRAVTSADVQRAIDAGTERVSRLQQRIYEEIHRGTVLIDASGETVGQVNGISVVDLGRYVFGRPSRITARVRLGKGEVVDIERETELGGPIHSKGVFILSGLIGSRYATDRPLSLSASLVFEQSYGPVEGDSASLPEVVALLSALSDVPVRQCVAVTGSVNQHGQVQAVGRVNEKIEAFFDVCRTAGLTGEQGVVIPASNRKHLMLRADVVEAAAAGRFRVWPVETVDQAIEVATGAPAGERDASGRYPERSVNGRVEARLTVFAEKLREFSGVPAVAAGTANTL